MEEIFLPAVECTWVNDVRQIEIHTAELLVPEPNAFAFELAIEKLKSHKSRGSDQIPAELTKAGDRTIRSEIHVIYRAYHFAN